MLAMLPKQAQRAFAGALRVIWYAHLHQAHGVIAS